MKRQTIRGKIFHFVLTGVLLFSLGAIALLPQPVSASLGEWALSFDGTDDYVNCGSGASFNTTEAITVEGWCKRTGSTSGVIAGRYDHADTAKRAWSIRWISNNYVYFNIGGFSVYSPIPVSDRDWHHFVGTYDRTDIKFYVDGVLKHSAEVTDAILTPAVDALIGAGYNSAPNLVWPFPGLIDEVRIYNRAITADEVTYSYNGGAGRYTPQSTDGLVGWWHMDEDTGPTINDETINANHGTIYGATRVEGFSFPPPPPISQIVFTTDPQTLLVNQASEPMTIQTRDAAGNPTPVTENTTINLGFTELGAQYSESLDPWVSTSSVRISAGNSDATFYFKFPRIGTGTITAYEVPDVSWDNATQVVHIQGPVELWRGMALIGTYRTIQEAIDAAEDGDVIIVLPGTYYEQIDIYKQITVKSRDGADTTIIDAEEGTALVLEPHEGWAIYPAVWIQKDGVVFGGEGQGFTIRNTFPMVFPEGGEDPSEYGMAILADAPGCHIEDNIIEDSNPVGIFADSYTTISGNVVSSSMMGIYVSGENGSTVTDNIVNSMYWGIYSQSPGSNISWNTVSNSWGGAIFVIYGDDNQITNNILLDNQGTVINLQHVSHTTVSENYISSDATDVAGIYGIQVEGGNNNIISGNGISYVLVGGITLNETSENNLSGNDIYDITGYTLKGKNGGNAWWTREQVMFERFSVRMSTGEEPSGVARLEMPTSFPFEHLGMSGEMGGGELYFWVYLADEYGYGSRDYWLDHEALLPTYQLELDTDGDGIADVTLSANTGCEELVANEWLKLYAMENWTDVDTTEEKSLSAWITDLPDASRVVKLSVIYSGAADKTMFIDGSMQEGMPMEPPKGIAIGRSDRNSVSDNGIYGINGAGILIVESSQNMLGDNNFIVDNGTGFVIEGSNENKVSGNIIADNDRGIRIVHSYNNQIIGNDIVWNTGGMSGIHLDGESDGNEIHANNIVENTPRDGAGNIIRDGEGNITSFGVVKDGGWVNASGNWWGDASGPYHERDNPEGMGDAVSNECVHFEPWANTELPEYELPIIVDNLAMPRMTAVLGMFMGDVGPEWTSLIVEAYDNEGGVGIAQVTVDLGALLEQMVPVIPSEKQEEWDNWLSELERSHLQHQDHGVYQRDFNLGELLHPLTWYLGEDDVQRIMCQLTLGDFFIPVTLTDWCGNESYGNIDLTIVDILQPVKEGWNLISTPVTLDENYAYWEDIFDLGGGFIYDVLGEGDVMWYDSSLQAWGDPPATLNPLDALYVYATGNAQIGIIFNREPTPPPMVDLYSGWNLVGLAIPPTEWNSMPVNRAMATVEDASGYRGYSVVVSLDQRVDYNEEYRYQDTEGGEYHFGGYGWNFHQSPWVYTIGSYNIPEMRIGGGYWVFMEEADTLAGFSTTPVTIIHQEEPETFVYATIGDTDSLDPAYAYDTASGAIIQAVYETLLFFDGESTTEFVPVLATEWDISPDGKTYRFRIREGVKFHNGNDLTPEDVEYSFERGMVQDRNNGPQWMLFEPLFGPGIHSSRTDGGLIPLEEIRSKVEVDGQWVQFNLFAPYEPFPQILAGTWGSIVDKEWCRANGDWDGSQASYEALNDPPSGGSPLQSIMNGTGPFRLEGWEPGAETVLVRNDNYWREPASLGKAVIKVVDDWTTRKHMLETGDADLIDVPREHFEELEGVEGITVYKDLPALQVNAFFFQLAISEESTFIGSGTFDGNGIPRDFFTDVNIRKGFAYAFDWETFIKDALMGEAQQIGSPICEGVSYFDPNAPKYAKDLDLAEAHFKEAGVWETGFTFTLAYNEGSLSRKTACEILRDNLSAINTKFNVNIVVMDWPELLRGMYEQLLPMFHIGWMADYPDAHNFVFPFMHSSGTFSEWQNYSDGEVDDLIEAGISAATPAGRESIYRELDQRYFDEVPSFILEQRMERRYFRSWVTGFYYNPILPGKFGNLYTLSKE